MFNTIENDLRMSLAGRSPRRWARREDGKSLIILMTPRAGSKWLGNVLTRTGVLGFPEEFVNSECIPDANRDLHAATEEEFLNGCVRSRVTDNGVFAIEATWGDIARFASIDFFQYFEQARFVWLRRKDILAQAISLLLATESRIFHLKNGAPVGPDSSEIRDIAFDHDGDVVDGKIREWVGHIINYETQTEVQLCIREVKPLRIYYEDLVADMRSVVLSIARLMEIELPAVSVPVSDFTPTSTQLNERIKRDFLRRQLESLNRFISIRPALIAE